MRALPALFLLLLCGCGPGLTFNASQEMTTDAMLRRADLVFVGVIEEHHFDSWPFFRVNIPDEDPQHTNWWKVLRRVVRVETVLRGHEARKRIDVYEIFWTGGASGNWNSTLNGERDLFLVRMEQGKYHVVRDWWRSIFPVTAGPRKKLPLDESRPLWERIALMNYWMHSNEESARLSYLNFWYDDPGMVLSRWRKVKLQRGLVRHPNPAIRVAGCRELLGLGGWGQDECWETLAEAEKRHLFDGGHLCCSAEEIAASRRQTDQCRAESWWRRSDREDRRLLTAINNRRLRREFCRLWQREYTGDHDNGCPADAPPPATIVTEQGDVPLIGNWPRN